LAALIPNTVASLVSFPKAGRTWLRFLLGRLNLPVAVTHDGAGHSEKRHFDQLKPPRASLLGSTVIFLLRDPRDTVVSGYFQAEKRLGGYAGGISDFIRDPCHGVEKIVRFNLLWADAPTDPALFLALSYEQMTADAATQIHRIAAFLGQERSADEITQAVAASSFERMQREERDGRFAALGDIMVAGDASDPDAFKVRRGKVGGFEDYLNRPDFEYCNEVIAKHDYWARAANGLRLPRTAIFANGSQ